MDNSTQETTIPAVSSSPPLSKNPRKKKIIIIVAITAVLLLAAGITTYLIISGSSTPVESEEEIDLSGKTPEDIADMVNNTATSDLPDGLAAAISDKANSDNSEEQYALFKTAAVVSYNKGDFESAAAYFLRAIELAPDDSKFSLYTSLSTTYQMLSDTSSEKAALESAFSYFNEDDLNQLMDEPFYRQRLEELGGAA